MNLAIVYQPWISQNPFGLVKFKIHPSQMAIKMSRELYKTWAISYVPSIIIIECEINMENIILSTLVAIAVHSTYMHAL